MKKLSRRTWILLGVVAVAAVAAIGGYAYFSAVGSGTGPFTTGSASGILLSSTTVGPLYPTSGNNFVPQDTGSTGTLIPLTLKNVGGGAQYVGTVTGTVGTIGSCNGPANFAVAPVVVNATLAPGTYGYTSSVQLVESGGDQNACQSGAFTITWSSS
jgi:hypothetical protein